MLSKESVAPAEGEQMGILKRLFGRHEEAGAPQRLEANESLVSAPSLQVLVSRRLALDEQGLGRALHAYDVGMEGVRVVDFTCDPGSGALWTLVCFGPHVVRLVGLDAPMPAAAVDATLGPAHLPPELEARARTHESHVLLAYAGYAEDPVEQWVALAAVAGALVVCADALVVMNADAPAALPARLLASEGPGALAHLRQLSLPLLVAQRLGDEAHTLH